MSSPRRERGVRAGVTRMAELVVDGRPTGVPARVATSRTARRRGLLGADGLDGVLVLAPCRQVHTIGMRFALDVAFCAGDGTVLRVSPMAPGRVSRPVLRARFVLEATAGSFAAWGLRPGVAVAVREHAARE